MATELRDRATVLAHFPVRLNLPDGQPQLTDDAAAAVRKEYRNSVRWKRLLCRKVEPLSEQPGESIFVLQLGQSVEFDWTWEGAVAFRPTEPGKFKGDIDVTDDFVNIDRQGADDSRHDTWAGEIVEVDATNGRIFISVGGESHPPCTGTFFVRPFEFLAVLHALFNQSEAADIRRLLPARLHAARGGVHPLTFGEPISGLDELKLLWRHSWAILWGPPGTGKTYTLGRQVAACMADSGERILVVSTTNRATDAAALAIGRAVRDLFPRAIEEGKTLRIGKGADWSDFQSNNLEGLLRGTETEILRELGILNRRLEQAKTHEVRAVLRDRLQELRRSMKDSAFNKFVCPDVQVVVGTAFKALTLLNDPEIRELIAAGESPFTTVVIDEAGLLSRAVASALSLLASRRVVIVGDAKQLAPISKISRILPTSQKMWLASSCLSHLQRVGQVDAGVHFLRVQHRMHPQISQVVSKFQYESALRDAPTVLTRHSSVPSLLKRGPRAVWYVLDEDCHDIPRIRADRGPGNRSWLRSGSRDVLAKLFSDPEIRQAKGLFITPFKAQAKDIATYFAQENLENWSAGTVHARQGTEADVVIFDTVNAGSTGWPPDEWKRLVNVGTSRARDFLILLASRAELSQHYLHSLSDTFAPRILKRAGRSVHWVDVPVRACDGHSEIADNPCLLGHQLAQRKLMRPIMSKEQQQLCGWNMDGKPRLVRGVAGSGKTFVLAHWLQRTVIKLADEPEARVWAVYANAAMNALICNSVDEAWKAEQPETSFPWDRVDICHVQGILAGLLASIEPPIAGRTHLNG